MVEPVGYRSEPLGNHDLSVFSCGVEALDRYLRERAGQDQRRKIAAPYVFLEIATGAIVGYYTLSSSSIVPFALPADITRRLPPYSEYPAILIGRLALDRRYHGRELGRRLLYDALHRCLVISQQVGSFAVIVDAKDDDARAFYEHLGFQPFGGHNRRLFIPMTSIARL